MVGVKASAIIFPSKAYTNDEVVNSIWSCELNIISMLQRSNC
jgi:hypothetical protein